MVEAIYTARNARNAGRDVSAFTNFLRGEITKGHIFIKYDRGGRPADTSESAAVYALACRLFMEERDNADALLCYRHMMDIRITGRKNPFQGGFGYSEGLTLYAFDQMEALLTQQMGGKGLLAE